MLTFLVLTVSERPDTTISSQNYIFFCNYSNIPKKKLKKKSFNVVFSLFFSIKGVCAAIFLALFSKILYFCTMFSINMPYSGLMLLDSAKVMAIVNFTPDSFFEGSRLSSEGELRSRLDEVLSVGADIIDLGACSTRPGAERASEAQERERLSVALREVERWQETVSKRLPLSLDTYRPEIAAEACSKHQIDIINDVSGGSERMYEVAAYHGAAYVLTHNGGFQRVADVVDYLQQRVDCLNRKGVHDIIIDPGFGFQKTREQDYLLLRHLGWIKQMLPLPLLAGMSRKRMVYEVLRSTPDQALAGTIAANTIALMRGADILRVHDVKEARDTISIAETFGRLPINNH